MHWLWTCVFLRFCSFRQFVCKEAITVFVGMDGQADGMDEGNDTEFTSRGIKWKQMWCKRMVYIVLQYHLMGYRDGCYECCVATACADLLSLWKRGKETEAAATCSLRGASSNINPKSGKRIMQLLWTFLTLSLSLLRFCIHIQHRRCTEAGTHMHIAHPQSLYSIFGLLLLPLLLLHRPQMVATTNYYCDAHNSHWRGLLVAY